MLVFLQGAVHFLNMSDMNSPKSVDAFTLARHPRNEVTVDDHDSLGSASGTTGVHHHGQI